MTTHTAEPWTLPLARGHALAASAGDLSFVGGAGDFDESGSIRHPGNLEQQIAGALANAGQALAAERCSLADAVKIKAFYRPDPSLDEWQVIAAIAGGIGLDPLPAISVLPTPLQPFAAQEVQIQIIASRGWRECGDIRSHPLPVPAERAAAFPHPPVAALRAGEFIALANRTAPDAAALEGDPVAQSHAIMDALSEALAAVGASLQDSVKMEGYYFGTTREAWAPLARARASHFHEPGPPATVVPCHSLHPSAALTKIEVMAMRERRNGFDKYIPRDDSWPTRVWDWPIELPYRQGIRLRDTVWLGGQVPSEPFSNSGRRVLGGALMPQTRFTLGYIEDILRGFDRGLRDLRFMVCYFTSSGAPSETEAFVDTLAESIGTLPPMTLIPQPHMHAPDCNIEIWGVAAG